MRKRNWLASLEQALQLLHRAFKKVFLFLQPVEDLDAVFAGELQHRWSLFSCRTVRFINVFRVIQKRNRRHVKCTIHSTFLKDNWYS